MNDETPPAPLSGIVSYHAHVYYDPATTRPVAHWLRERLAERFAVQLGRWHDVPVGPHTAAMYQVAFDVDVLPGLLPWLMLNRRGLDVLVHPNTLAPQADHLVHALWLGRVLPLKGERLAQAIAAQDEDPVRPNTTPFLAA